MAEIMVLVVDGKINTKEEAAAFVTEQAELAADFYHKPIEETRANLLANIGYCTGYYPADAADRIMDLFETEHPVFGRLHPTAEEAYRMGQELAEKMAAKMSDPLTPPKQKEEPDAGEN